MASNTDKNAPGVIVDPAAADTVKSHDAGHAQDMPGGVTQAEPTQEQKRDSDGFVLDEWDLPLSGPRRMEMLAEMEMPDPQVDLAGWNKAMKSAAKTGDDTQIVKKG